MKRKKQGRRHQFGIALIFQKFQMQASSEYISPTLQGDTPIIEIESEDIEYEIEYWRNSIVCYALGAHPPFVAINGYIQRIWAKHGLNKIVILKNGIILVRFDTEMGKMKLYRGYIPL